MEIKYDPFTQYCPVRRILEERSLNLVGRLAIVTERLLQLTGRNHAAFVDTKTECQRLHIVIVDAWRDAHEHRSAHGC